MPVYSFADLCSDPPSRSRCARNWFRPCKGVRHIPPEGGEIAVWTAFDELLVGRVIRTPGQAGGLLVIELWGSRQRVELEREDVVGCKPVDHHTWADRCEVAARQRRGEPALFLGVL